MHGSFDPPVVFLASESFVSGFELPFTLKLLGSLFVGYVIGSERELRGKPAGISTHTYVIAGSMLFTLMSTMFGAGDPTRIAAQMQFYSSLSLSSFRIPHGLERLRLSLLCRSL